MKKKIEQEWLYLGIVLLFAFIIRAFNFFELSFLNDELSALARTRFNSFSELINKGVLPDGHPPLIQVFLYYWSAMFGYSEAVVKFPFLLVGMFSLYYLYLLAKEFSQSATTSLILTLFFAVNQLHVEHSTIARMYITGFFFAIALVYHWHLWIKTDVKKHLYLMVLFAVLSAYNHHMTFLFALIVWLSGWIYIQKEQYKLYIIAFIVVTLAYLPCVYITYYQLFETQGLNWVSKPDTLFVEDFFRYILHYNPILYLIIIAGLVMGFFKKEAKNGLILLGFVWFIAVFLISYIYSVQVAPVLQNHLMLFALPFLILAAIHVWSFILDEKKLLIAGLSLCAISLFSLTFGRAHFKIFPYQPHREIAKNIKEYASENVKVLVVSNLNLNYLEQYLGKDMSGVDTLSELDFNKVKYSDILKKYDFIISASTNSAAEAMFTPEYEPIKASFQGIGCEIEVLKRRVKPFQKQSLLASTDFSHTQEAWLLTPERIKSTNGKFYYYKDALEPWGPSYQAPLKKGLSGLLCFEIDYVGGEKDGEMGVVINILDASGKELTSVIHDHVMKNRTHGKSKARAIIDLDNLPAGASIVKAFHWKKSENSTIEIHQMRLYNMPKIPVEAYKNDSIISYRDFKNKIQEPWNELVIRTDLEEPYGENYIRLDEGKSWFPSTSFTPTSEATYAYELEFKGGEINPETKLIIDLKVNNESVYYTTKLLIQCLNSNNTTWTKAVVAIPDFVVKKYLEEKITVEAVFLKEEGAQLFIKNPMIKKYKANPYLFGLINEIEE